VPGPVNKDAWAESYTFRRGQPVVLVVGFETKPNHVEAFASSSHLEMLAPSNRSILYRGDLQPSARRGSQRILRYVSLPARLLSLFLSFSGSSIGIERAGAGTDSDGERQQEGGEPVPPFVTVVFFLLWVPALILSRPS
jgi:hypothetical protein